MWGIVLGMLGISPALGADAVTWTTVTSVQLGQGDPKVVFQGHDYGLFEATVSCGDRRWTVSESVTPGAEFELVLRGLPTGQHPCGFTMSLESADGTRGGSSGQIVVTLLPMLALEASVDDVDLAGGALVVHAGRPVKEARLRVLGERGALLGQATADLADAKNPRFAWTASEAEVLRLEVDATDVHGFSSQLVLLPWSYQIPHIDVVFETGSHAIGDAEAPKLEASYAELAAVLKRYGDIVEARLYVAGYTDTVGDAASNLALSSRRARSIARWFRARGFTGEVWFQGFGERAQAVSTGDGVDEPRNRRALYVVAADAPAISHDLPSRAWQRL